MLSEKLRHQRLEDVLSSRPKRLPDETTRLRSELSSPGRGTEPTASKESVNFQVNACGTAQDAMSVADRVKKMLLASNHNNNIQDDSDSDDLQCGGGGGNSRSRKLHFITFLAGSNELHCMFEPSESPQPCFDIPSLRRGAYSSGRSSPDFYTCPSEKSFTPRSSPILTCSKMSVEDSISDWLRNKERNRCSDANEKLFGTRRSSGRRSNSILGHSSSDTCCRKKTFSFLCGDEECKSPCDEPVRCQDNSKQSFCLSYRKCVSPLPTCCSGAYRPKIEDCSFRPLCTSPSPCKPCCQPPMLCKMSSSCPSSCVSCSSCSESKGSEMTEMKYKQFRKDYVKKWGIKISNSDGGEWVYKDTNSIFPLFGRKNGKVTKITLLNENTVCGMRMPKCDAVGKSSCADSPRMMPCCNFSKRHRRGSFCRNPAEDDSMKRPVVTCFIERGGGRKCAVSTIGERPMASSPHEASCAQPVSCLKPTAIAPKCTSCLPSKPSRPQASCFKQTCCQKPFGMKLTCQTPSSQKPAFQKPTCQIGCSRGEGACNGSEGACSASQQCPETSSGLEKTG